MSDYIVKVERITVEPHDNADVLEIARVGDYRSIVKKGQFKTGDLVAYIPEAGVVPDNILMEMGLEGRLAGSKKNRVKAIKLRGVLSQGLCYPARDGWVEGQDVTEELGIVKWEPPIPAQLAGEVFNAGTERCIKYDIENFKRYPNVIQEGEEVVFTEKIHGTWCQLGVMPPELAHPEEGQLIVTSKGLGSRGLAFKRNEKNGNNLYLRVANKLDIFNKVVSTFAMGSGNSIFILGEVFGNGVQDLTYGASTAKDDTLGFRVFDIYIRQLDGKGRYVEDASLDTLCNKMGLERVPALYRGPFSKETMEEFTSGKEAVSGKESHIREGIVIRPVSERYDLELGRVQLKSVSEKYLLRKGGTEYN